MLCEGGLLDSVVSATGLSNVDTFLSSCRKDPLQSGQAIVALVRPRTEGDHAGDAAGSTRFDVDMVIWDIAKQTIVARGSDPGVLLSDASPLRGTSIDTARYAVAPGVRAFGLRDEHFPHTKPCGNIRTEKEVSTYDGTTYGPVAIRMYLHPFD
jgi:hypothetical protein